jgi:SNF family Na+-dependent transporter
MQTLGALMAVLTFAWVVDRSTALAQLSSGGERAAPLWLYYWLRFVVPGAILLVGMWWLVTEVLQATRAV